MLNLTEEERRNMGKAGRAKIINQYDEKMKKIFQTIEDLSFGKSIVEI